jgi:hypothetical protein
MNDLDLHTALQRDADLVGEPAPDLLEQLGRRHRHQRRQRAGVLSAVLGVVVIAAGIPLGHSLLVSSESATATDPVAPTSSISAPLTSTAPSAPTAMAVPTAAGPTAVRNDPTAAASPTTVAAAPSSVAAPTTSSGERPAGAAVPCPGVGTLQAALPADTAQDQPVCSGSWAAAGYSEITALSPEEAATVGSSEIGDGQAGLFRYVDGAWTQLDRDAHCADAGIPSPVWERACNVD